MQCIRVKGEKVYRGICGGCGTEWQIREHEIKQFEEINGKIVAYEQCLKCSIGAVKMIKVGYDD